MRTRAKLRYYSHSDFSSSDSYRNSFSFSKSTQTRPKIIFEFQNLEVYKKAKAFHVACRQIIAKSKLDTYVKDQLGRASFSIALNIAEGSSKFSKPDRRNYFTTARGSMFECVAVLDILKDQHILTTSEFEIMLKDADELSRILFAMIRNLS